MSPWQNIIKEIVTMLKAHRFDVHASALTVPPDAQMGDIALPCFDLSKVMKKNPSAIAEAIAADLRGRVGGQSQKLITGVEAKGPYVNFFVNTQALAEQLLKNIDTSYGQLTIGKKKKHLVEYGCPNPLKTFHLGHLKNLITGESVARILANAGYTVVRVNYQGDVGMHIAKTLWFLETQNSKLKTQNSLPLGKKIQFLGQAYAEGARAFEENEQAKKEIVAMNKRVYEKDPEIQEWYQLAVAWSLEYFDQIYKRLGTRFDRLYMESEVVGPGEQIVRENLKKGIFKESEGAVIYEGSKCGLHDRVFINSEGFPTYEAKDLGLAEAHFTEHDPDRIIHVVGKEQSEYFKVVFKAIGDIWPQRADKEFHLPGGFLQLKDGKMSSRTGNVVSAEELLALSVAAVKKIMKDRELPEKDTVVETVAVSAIKYSILKVGVSDDVVFDLKTSVSFEGDSGPYLLYTAARINSILKKSKTGETSNERASEIRKSNKNSGGKLRTTHYALRTFEERALLLHLARFPDIVASAATTNDPSLVCKFLFDLAKSFSNFYEACPVITSEDSLREARLALIGTVGGVIERGLALLGIKTVPEM